MSLDTLHTFWIDWGPLVQTASPVITIAASIIMVGIFFGTRLQIKNQLREQKLLIQEQGRQSIQALELGFERQDRLQLQTFAQHDAADRQLVVDYIMDFVARLDDLALLRVHNLDTAPDEVQKKYNRVRTFFTGKVVDHVHHDRNWGAWYAFLLFQIIGAFNVVLLSRWQRPLTDEQKQFLKLYDDRLAPALTSSSYPGKRFIYRDQLDVIADSVLVRHEHTSLLRPVNWVEFVSKYNEVAWFKELVEIVAGNFRIIVGDEPLDDRKNAQARLCMLVLYMISILKSSGINFSAALLSNEEGLWEELGHSFIRHTKRTGRKPDWYVFERGDIEARAEQIRNDFMRPD